MLVAPRSDRWPTPACSLNAPSTLISLTRSSVSLLPLPLSLEHRDDHTAPFEISDDVNNAPKDGSMYITTLDMDHFCVCVHRLDGPVVTVSASIDSWRPGLLSRSSHATDITTGIVVATVLAGLE